MSVEIHHRANPPFISRTSCLYRSGAGSTASTYSQNELSQLAQGRSTCSSRSRNSPATKMSATYQPPMSAYDGHALHNYGSVVGHGGNPKPTMEDARGSQQYRYPPQHTAYRNGPFVPSSQISDASSFQTSKPSTPTVDAPVVPRVQSSSSRRGSETLIYHSLQIPRCISPSGGNLCDFAAQMTCLFWFESIDELKVAETTRSRPANSVIPRLPALARPHEQFCKWVYNVLSTTQVTQNVIFLALLFIYRLKMSTPQIKGRAGSEYRLLTVALMLGNKFLDDNTYTNKTWAEVSCFAVQEIHVMEVEFLSNMRYNLLASKDEWETWIGKLSSFHEYYDRALKLPASPIHSPSPASKALHSPIPSPTGTSMPPFTPGTKMNLSPSSRHSHKVSAYQTNTTSPLASKPSIPLPVSRKRSPDDDLADHPAKRLVHHNGQVLQVAPNARLNGSVDSSRVPIPQLSVVTNPNLGQNQTQYTGVSNTCHLQGHAAGQQFVSLPPLQSGVRAMATVYQPSPSGGVLPPSAGPVTTGSAIPGSVYPTAPVPTQAPMAYGTPTKHPSPNSLMPPYGSSPLVEPFGPGSAIHTPISHTPISSSPSVYLQHRASPYKPIRHVNRLLYPPPSASLDQYHLSVPVPPNQMHYQPLGRRHDLRTGIVPEFLVYHRGQQQQFASHGQGGGQGHYPS